VEAKTTSLSIVHTMKIMTSLPIKKKDNDKSTMVKKRRRMTKKVKAWHSKRRRRRRRSDMQYVLSRIVMLRQVKKRETPPSL
jgi:hypothetical protein